MSDPYAQALDLADRRARPRGTPKAARRAKPHPRPPQPERNRLILALWALDRMSFSGIAERAGCTRNAVAGVIDRDRKRRGKGIPAGAPSSGCALPTRGAL